MKKSKKVFLGVLVGLLILILIYAVVIAVVLIDFMDDYAFEPGWYCQHNEFEGLYYDLMCSKIDELESKYDLDFERSVEKKEYDTLDEIVLITKLSNDVATVKIEMINRVELAKFEIVLFFHSSDEYPKEDYEAQRPYVDFINDFTNFAAYDTKNEEGNFFEILYNRCDVESEHTAEWIHFDDLIGNVGYNFYIDNDNDCYRYLYTFEGVMKPPFWQKY